MFVVISRDKFFLVSGDKQCMLFSSLTLVQSETNRAPENWPAFSAQGLPSNDVSKATKSRIVFLRNPRLNLPKRKDNTTHGLETKMFQ